MVGWRGRVDGVGGLVAGCVATWGGGGGAKELMCGEPTVHVDPPASCKQPSASLLGSTPKYSRIFSFHNFGTSSTATLPGNCAEIRSGLRRPWSRLSKGGLTMLAHSGPQSSTQIRLKLAVRVRRATISDLRALPSMSPRSISNRRMMCNG